MQQAFKCIEMVAESGTLLQLLSNNRLYARDCARLARLRSSRYFAYKKFTRRLLLTIQVNANTNEYNDLS